MDVHHLTPRAEGGSHDPDLLVTLCGAHHRAGHRGQLLIEGRVSTGLVFRHADGSPYGQLNQVRQADVRKRVFAALRNLRFRETEAKRALALVEADQDTPLELEPLLRAALAKLAPQ